MQISDVLSKMNINISPNPTAPVQNAEGVKNVAAEPQIQESNLYNLAEGEIFSGTVSEGDNQKVLVTLSNGDTFTARPESGVELLKDQTAYFMVTGNDKGKMSLKLLTQNQNASPTILKALGSAGYEVTDRAIDMVKSMMDKNLPLDPETVGNMVKNAAFFEGESTDVLATLKKLGVSINDMNIEQLKAYDNGEGKLETPIGKVTQELPEVIAKSGDGRAAIQIAKALAEESDASGKPESVGKEAVLNKNEFMEMPAKGESASKVNIEKLVASIDKEMTEIAKQEVEAATVKTAGEEVRTTNTQQNQQTVQPGTAGEQIIGTSGETAAIEIDGKTILNQELIDLIKTGENGEDSATNIKDAVINANAANESLQDATNGKLQQILQNNSNLSQEELLKLNQGLTEKESINPEILKSQLPEEAVNKAYTKLLNELIDLLKDNNVAEKDVAKLFSSNPVKELLSKSMQEQWFMKPDAVEDKEELDKFYNKMNKQLTRIQEALNGNKNVPAELAKNVADIKNNLSFINEANHLYQYVQIPIKMASEHATGDLYVYTNKKNLRDPKQEITAHLHLEMEHLGTTDVDILLRQKKLSTHFMLADEDSLNLVLEHIDILTERLSNKGFDVNIDASGMQEDGKEDFLSKLMGMPLPKINYSKQSFDVKV
ncbi:MAG: flagellar hook-length control protein FliK [Lachnospiraceae bacterium]|nr:flagellar hook-length control protein FliK [Lachnospiraceae bacterium]